MICVKNVVWVLHTAGFCSPVRFSHHCKFSDVSDLQSPIDGGNSVMMTSEVAWIIQMRAGNNHLSIVSSSSSSKLADSRDCQWYQADLKSRYF